VRRVVEHDQAAVAQPAGDIDASSFSGDLADEGVGYIVREPDRHEILVRPGDLALGVDALYEGDRVALDVHMGPTRRRVT
jgi:cold shock CspA family protein